MLMRRAHMDEVDVTIGTTRLVLREAIELRLARTPIVISCPIVDDILEIAQRHALRPIIDRFRLRPSRGEQTAPEILKFGLSGFDSKRPDVAHGSVLDSLEYRQRGSKSHPYGLLRCPTSLSQTPPAIDGERIAGDVAGRLRREERHCGCDVGRVTERAHRNLRH